MKAKKAIQQKMCQENSWGDGKQRLEKLFKFSFFDRFVVTGLECKQSRFFLKSV